MWSHLAEQGGQLRPGRRIVVDDLPAATAFFTELGLKLQARASRRLGGPVVEL